MVGVANKYSGEYCALPYRSVLECIHQVELRRGRSTRRRGIVWASPEDSGVERARERMLRRSHKTSLKSLARAASVFVRLLPLICLFNVASPALLRAQTVLAGNQVIESNIDTNVLGLAEAFQSTATASGQVGSINVFLDASSTATKIYAGIYTNNNGNPGALLTQGNSTQLSRGTWNTIAVTAVNLTSGTSYWIAILGTTSGQPYFRDRSTTNCQSQTSSQSTLTSLPSTWTKGQTWPTCYISAYAVSGTSSAKVMIGNQAVEGS